MMAKTPKKNRQKRRKPKPYTIYDFCRACRSLLLLRKSVADCKSNTYNHFNWKYIWSPCSRLLVVLGYSAALKRPFFLSINIKKIFCSGNSNISQFSNFLHVTARRVRNNMNFAVWLSPERTSTSIPCSKLVTASFCSGFKRKKY